MVMGAAPRLARLSGRITWAPPAGRSGMAGLAYRLEGHGVPATVLVHGLFASGRYWGKAYDGLARDSALVVPDLAGFGRSVEVVDGFGPEAHADLVARTLGELGLTARPAVIGAHSLGCLVAIELARRHPHLVAGIVAFSPPLYDGEAAARRHLRGANPLIRLFIANPSLSEAVCDWMCEHPRFAGRLGRVLRPELPRALAEDRFKHTYRSYSETLAKVVVSAGAAAVFHELRIPIHLVAGAQDGVVDRKFLEDLAATYDHLELSVWPGAEHELPLTHPAACVSEIERMGARVGIVQTS